MEYDDDGYWGSWYSNRRINKGTGRLENERTSEHYPNSYITEIGQNIEKSPGNLRRLDVTQTSMKNHQLTLMWKTQWVNDDNNNNDNHIIISSNNYYY